MKNLLLTEGVEKKWVLKTDLTERLTVDGITKTYPVYSIKLNHLYFNDKNDRIATWIAEHKSKNQITSFDVFDEGYNDMIHQFIVNSKEDAIKTTTTNMMVNGQQRPGVVLADGRIIDGNRRFTCLRNLADTGSEFNWFNAVILDYDIEDKDAEKIIKLLELELQHGREERVDYNPIDRLVGIYRDIVETKLVTEEEYRNKTGWKKSKLKDQIEKANLMVEFLKFIEAEKQYHIARDLELDGPLHEILSVLKKIEDEDDREDIKGILFTNVAMKPKNSIVPFIRNLGKALVSEEKEVNEKLVSDQREYVEEFLEVIEELGMVSADDFKNKIRTNEELRRKLEESAELASEAVKRNQTLEQPVKLAEKVFKDLEAIRLDMLKKMERTELSRLQNQLNHIERKLSEIKDRLGEVL
ncbi:MAG: hypothetical protein K2G70_00440 [Turicibacter sp.]|nr:hypothetical protein [Turicibacter sp.]